MAERADLILHITSAEAWEAAKAAGEYRAESLETEGYIHFSTPEQVLDVANDVYAGEEGLVLLVVDPEKVEPPLVWEEPGAPGAPATAEEFPHVYGPLNVNAVDAVVNFPPDPDGTFTLPEVVTSLI